MTFFNKMKKVRIILIGILIFSLLSFFFVWLTEVIKTYAAETERSNLIYTILNQEKRVEDIVYDYSSYDEIIDLIETQDTLWAEQNVYSVVTDYNLSGVALMNRTGEVLFSNYENANLDSVLVSDAGKFIRELYYHNIIKYYSVVDGSVYLIMVARLRKTDKTQPVDYGYFVAVECINVAGGQGYKLLMGRDTLNFCFDDYLYKFALFSPEKQTFGYVSYEFSKNYNHILGILYKVYIIFFVLGLLVFFITGSMICRANFTKAEGNNKKDDDLKSDKLSTLQVVTPEISDMDLKPFYEAVSQNYAGIIMTDPLGKITFTNRSFENASGYSKEELIENQPTLFVNETGASIFNYDFWRRLSTGTAWKGILYCIRKDNSLLKLSSTFSPIKNNGFVTGYAAVFEDAGQKNYYVDELREINRKYSAIVENCSDVIWIYDYKLKKIVFVSPAVKNLLGFTQNEVMKMSLPDLFDEVSYHKIRHFFSQKMSKNDDFLTQQNNLRFDCKIKCYDHNYLDIELAITLSQNNTAGHSEIIAITRDISEHRTILKRLSDSESKYRMIAENTADMIWKVDAATLDINYVSKAVSQQLGYTQAEFLKMNLRDILSEDSTERILQRAARISKENIETVNHRFKCLTICKNGEVKELESVVSTVTDSYGHLNFLGVSRDVTEALKSERRLKNTLSQMRTLLETMPAKIFMKDVSNRFILANTMFTNGLGVTLDKITGRRAEEIPLDSQFDLMVKQDWDILKTGVSYINQEIFIRSVNDNGKWYSVSQVPYSDNGKTLGIIGFMVDISSRKLYEQILKDNNNQFENILINFSDAYIRTDIAGRILKVNPALCDFIGVSSSNEIVGKKVFDVIDTDINWADLAHSRRVKNYAFKMRNRNGKNIYCEASITAYTDNAGNIAGFEGICRNITERKLHERQLNTLTQDLMNSLEQAKVQKNVIEANHRGITESLNYAKRIQEALLKSSFETISNYIPNSFILYSPRDVVGGDFIYVCTTSEGLVCAVGDCTGHGIPGALMSVLAISLLNDIFGVTYRTYTPKDVLEELRKRIIATLSNSLILRDGLDICMIFKGFQSDKLVYSGANIPLFICRGGKLITLKPTRCPIGLYPIQNSFENQEFTLSKNDMIYLSSDGYADQFGIAENRKYSQKDFTELLTRISRHDISLQKSDLENTLASWRGTRKQTDDITVFGIRVSEFSENNAI